MISNTRCGGHTILPCGLPHYSAAATIIAAATMELSLDDDLFVALLIALLAALRQRRRAAQAERQIAIALRPTRRLLSFDFSLSCWSDGDCYFYTR